MRKIKKSSDNHYSYSDAITNRGKALGGGSSFTWHGVVFTQTVIMQHLCIQYAGGK